jgi:hypothetical protein
MKLRLSILLLAAALAASPAAGQTIKSLGYNTTNGNIVAATNVTFTNSVGFATNAQAATRTNLGGTTVGDSVFTATNAAAAATAIGLGAANTASFDSLIIGAGSGDPLNVDYYQIESPSFNFLFHWEERRLAQGGNDIFSWNSTNATFPVPVSFSTNVTVNGNLSVGSLTTTTPSTWALDATQTAAATNGILALPSNANVIRLTNNNAISGVSGGVLGAFYYLVNQATNAVTISNVGGITVQGGTPLTLGANQAATLVATGATNASVAARGDLNDVALGGTANTAPSQTASSGSSLMTRDLVGQEFANPRNRMQTTYWFGLEGLGEWSTIGTAAVSAYVAGGGGGFGGGRAIYSSGRVGANHAGAGLRLGADNTTGGSPFRFSDGGALTMRAQVRKTSVVPRPAIAFLMGSRTATQMWQQNAYGLYFVPQPTDVWTSSGAVTQHDRIAVGNVVWAVNTAGINDATEPTWTDLIGSLVTNGSAVYRNLGPHTSNNWVLAIGSTNASQVVMTNTGKIGPPDNNRQEVVLKLRIAGTTNTPYTIYGSVETGTSSGNSAGESTEVSLTTTNNDFRQPQFWSRYDEEGGLAVQPDPIIRYFAIDGQMPTIF